MILVFKSMTFVHSRKVAHALEILLLAHIFEAIRSGLVPPDSNTRRHTQFR